MKEPTNPGAIVTRTRLAHLLGVTRGRVHQIESDAAFPAPYDVDPAGKPVWKRKTIERWAAKAGYELRGEPRMRVIARREQERIEDSAGSA